MARTTTVCVVHSRDIVGSRFNFCKLYSFFLYSALDYGVSCTGFSSRMFLMCCCLLLWRRAPPHIGIVCTHTYIASTGACLWFSRHFHRTHIINVEFTAARQYLSGRCKDGCPNLAVQTIPHGKGTANSIDGYRVWLAHTPGLLTPGMYGLHMAKKRLEKKGREKSSFGKMLGRMHSAEETEDCEPHIITHGIHTQCSFHHSPPTITTTGHFRK